MKIAVASSRPDFGGHVPELFGRSPYLLIVETDDGRLLQVVTRDGSEDAGLARQVLQWDCEGLLCGPLEREPFLIVADEGGVTRYLAAGRPVAEALALMEGRQLEHIRDYIGGRGCGGERPSGGGDCPGHHH